MSERKNVQPHNSNSQTSRLHLTSLPQARQRGPPARPGDDAGIRIAVPERRLHVPRTAARPALIRGRDVDEGDAEAGVQRQAHQRRQRPDRRGCEPYRHHDGEHDVEHRRPGDGLDGADPARGREVVVGERRQEVRKEGEDDGRAGELDGPEEELERAEGGARSGSHRFCVSSSLYLSRLVRISVHSSVR